MNNKPIFTKVELFPQKFNPLMKDLIKMDDDSFYNFVEQLRIHFVRIHKTKHPVFSTNRTEEKIQIDLKRFMSEEVESFTEMESFKPLLGEIDDESKYLLKYRTKYSNAVNHWFPEIWDTKISTGKSVTDQFYIPKDFNRNLYAIIKKDRFKFAKNNQDGEIRIGDFLIQCLRIVNGNQPVYNFPSSLAEWIYLNKVRRLEKRKDLYILDMSMGWAGRMIGSLALCSRTIMSGKKVYYYGTDVNTITHDRFKKIEDYWRENVSGEGLDYEMYKSILPAENLLDDDKFKDKLNTFDIMFTSPPYFNKEMYSDDTNQSYKNYDNNYDAWRDGFLNKMVQNTYDLLRPGGEAWINIADVKYKGSKYHPLQSDTIAAAEAAGFEHVRTYKMIFGVMVGLDKRSKLQKEDDKNINKKKMNKNTKGDNPKTKNTVEFNGKKYKFEPIFVFKKNVRS